MSCAALVCRLNDLDILSDRYCQQWWRYIAKMGWRKIEPEATPPDELRWFLRSTLRAVSEGLVTEEYAERLLGAPLPRADGLSRRRALAAMPKEHRAAALAKHAGRSVLPVRTRS